MWNDSADTFGQGLKLADLIGSTSQQSPLQCPELVRHWASKDVAKGASGGHRSTGQRVCAFCCVLSRV